MASLMEDLIFAIMGLTDELRHHRNERPVTNFPLPVVIDAVSFSVDDITRARFLICYEQGLPCLATLENISEEDARKYILKNPAIRDIRPLASGVETFGLDAPIECLRYLFSKKDGERAEHFISRLIDKKPKTDNPYINGLRANLHRKGRRLANGMKQQKVIMILAAWNFLYPESTITVPWEWPS